MYGCMDEIFPLFPQFPRTGRSLVDSRGYVIHLRQGEPSQFILELSQLGSRHIGASHLRTSWCLYKMLRVANCFFFLFDSSITLHRCSLRFPFSDIVTLAVLTLVSAFPTFLFFTPLPTLFPPSSPTPLRFNPWRP